MSVSISGDGALTGIDQGLNVVGVVTVSTINAVNGVFSGNISVAGTVTYEDVTNVDSVGVVTARSGIVIGTGTSISSPSSNVLTLGTNNSERVRINSSGRVGIGTNVYPNNEMLVVDNINGSSAYNTKFVYSGTTNTSYAVATWTHGQSGTAVGYAGVGGSNTGNPSFRNTFVVGTQNANDLVLNTNDSERLRIDSNGNITTPYNPVFFAYTTSVTSTASGYNGILSDVFTTTLCNVGGHYKTSGGDVGKFVAPIAGVYEFHGQALLRANGSTTAGELTFYKNGSNISVRAFGYQYVTGGSDHDNLHIMIYVSLTAGDKVDFRSINTGSGLDWYQGQGLAYFSGKLIG